MIRDFYMVFLEDCSTPKFKHMTLESAEKEAKRLAELHQRKAYVLCTLKSFELDKFRVEDLRPDDRDDLPF